MTKQIPLPPNNISPLIGPHEGRELELMLAGKKKLALWTEATHVFDENPEWIPQEAFAPHVAAGRINRHMHDYDQKYQNQTILIRVLGFTLPGEEWRFAAYVFLRQDWQRHRNLYGDADDIVIGRLLGYKGIEIKAFLEHRKRLQDQRDQTPISPSLSSSSSPP